MEDDRSIKQCLFHKLIYFGLNYCLDPTLWAKVES